MFHALTKEILLLNYKHNQRISLVKDDINFFNIIQIDPKSI